MSTTSPVEQRMGGISARPNWRDLGAGLCVAGLLLPEAVAYAGLARLPVSHALAAMIAGLLIYALLGRSRFAIVAPTSSAATLAAAAVLSVRSTTQPIDAATYTQAFMALVLLAGVILVLLAWARQGQMAAFVSRPVLRGFAFALAITIVIKQLPDALGLAVPATIAHDTLHMLLFVVGHVPQWHWLSLGVALASTAALLVFKRWPQLPASMLVIVLAIAAAQVLDLHAAGVAQVGVIERPSLRFGLPELPLADWLRIGELAFGLVVIVFAESWGSVRGLALAHGDPALDANRELLALGACNVGAALLQGMPVGAGFSASSANASAGAASRWAGVAALAVVVAALAVALPALQLLPRPVLAVAVVSALWHALNPKPLLEIWRMNRDRVPVIGAVAAVLMLGVLYGMLIAIAISLIDALRHFSQPVVHELGQLGETRNYVDLQGQPGAKPLPGLLILRPEEPLFFGSADRVAADVLQRVQGRDDVRTVVLSLEESADLDCTAVECLLELDRHLHSGGRLLVLSRAKDAVRELLQRWDPQGLGHADRLFWSVDDAARAQLR